MCGVAIQLMTKSLIKATRLCNGNAKSFSGNLKDIFFRISSNFFIFVKLNILKNQLQV